MPLPDFTSPQTFPPFSALPFTSSTAQEQQPLDQPYYLLAQITQNMTLTKPTLILTDSAAVSFALVFDSRPGAGPETLDLKSMGLKPGSTLVLEGAKKGLPPSASPEDGKQGHVVVSREEEGKVKAIPAGREKVVKVGEWLRKRDGEGKKRGCESCGRKEEQGLKRCTGCGEVEYCSKECQVKGWHDGHKADCKVIKAIREIWS